MSNSRFIIPLVTVFFAAAIPASAQEHKLLNPAAAIDCAQTANVCRSLALENGVLLFAVPTAEIGAFDASAAEALVIYNAAITEAKFAHRDALSVAVGNYDTGRATFARQQVVNAGYAYGDALKAAQQALITSLQPPAAAKESLAENG